jgi:ATP-dependent RNA helicase DHX29
MAKKKKTQLKPIARGFATTSLPKKIVPGQDEEPSPAADAAAPAQEADGAVLLGAPPSSDAPSDAKPVAAQADEFDPEKAEEQSLQNLVDRLQERTEKDVKRTVKVRVSSIGGVLGLTNL